MKVNKKPTRCSKDDLFIGVSTCFGHHHAHHQQNSYKADNAHGVQHWSCCSRPEEKRWFGVHLLGLVSRKLYTIGVVGFVLFS
jgi:hypothetical protein